MGSLWGLGYGGQNWNQHSGKDLKFFEDQENRVRYLKAFHNFSVSHWFCCHQQFTTQCILLPCTNAVSRFYAYQIWSGRLENFFIFLGKKLSPQVLIVPESIQRRLLFFSFFKAGFGPNNNRFQHQENHFAFILNLLLRALKLSTESLNTFSPHLWKPDIYQCYFEYRLRVM